MDSLLKIIMINLWDLGAIKTKEQSPDGRGFRLKLHDEQPEAPLSPIYLNLRTPENPKPGPIEHETLEAIGVALCGKLVYASFTFDRIAGIPHAGTPLAQALAPVMKRELVRMGKIKDGTSHGKIVCFENAPHRKVPTLLVDDVATKANSKLEAIQALSEKRHSVEHVLVLIDREQGAAAELRKHGVFLHSALTISEMLQFYVMGRFITSATYNEIMDYIHTTRTT